MVSFLLRRSAWCPHGVGRALPDFLIDCRHRFPTQVSLAVFLFFMITAKLHMLRPTALALPAASRHPPRDFSHGQTCMFRPVARHAHGDGFWQFSIGSPLPQLCFLFRLIVSVVTKGRKRPRKQKHAKKRALQGKQRLKPATKRGKQRLKGKKTAKKEAGFNFFKKPKNTKFGPKIEGRIPPALTHPLIKKGEKRGRVEAKKFSGLVSVI
jgi:hypothetical protein